MRFWCLVLIAAVAVNSLVTTINAKSTSNSVTEPFNMLLPPLAAKAEDVAAAKTSTKATPATATTVAPPTKKTTSKTKATLKPLTNDVNKVAVPELSIEALLPPLFEANIEKEENNNKQQTAATAVETTTLRTITTTTARTTTTTTARTTVAPKTTSTTKSSAALQPSLSLDALVPPVEGEVEEDTYSVSTAKPDETKSTKKSYYQQQRQNLKQLQVTETSRQDIGENSDDAASNLKSKSLPQNIISDIESLATQQVDKQVAERNQPADSQSRSAINNYSFNLYLGSTTPRPAKQGLPTITPFPHRLGR